MSGDNKKEQFSEIVRLKNNGEIENAFNILSSLASPDDTYPVQQRCAKMFSSLSIKDLSLQSIKVAVIASSSTEHITPVLAYWLAKEGFCAEIWAAPFDSAGAMTLDANSPLYEFGPDFVWIMNTWRDVDLLEIPGATAQEISKILESAIGKTTALIQAIHRNRNCQIIVNNADIPTREVFGALEGNVPWSFRSLLRQYNLQILDAIGKGVTVFDLDHLSAVYGKSQWEDPRYWYHSKNAFSFDAIGAIAFNFARMIGAIKGHARKCLVLDLDNTLWGGVIGDDGIEGIKLGAGVEGEAFVDFQHYIKALKERGIILAVCSKNDIDNARSPFENHPDMVLSLSDIAIFIANWENKADNIRLIANKLNIGLDALVFCDDNPVERELIRNFLPMVAVPELPEDPTGYGPALQAGRYFETLSFSHDDSQRAEYYATNAARDDLKESYTDLSGFLRDLDMVATVGEIDQFHRPRAAQLINKSNQFHLTGTRYTEIKLEELAGRSEYMCSIFKLRDRFGDQGLISVIILNHNSKNELIIDTWVMSCRVLGRGMEEFITSEILNIARRVDARTIVGNYVRSKKNGLVAELYKRLGFKKISENKTISTWHLEASRARDNEYFIAREQITDA